MPSHSESPTSVSSSRAAAGGKCLSRGTCVCLLCQRAQTQNGLPRWCCGKEFHLPVEEMQETGVRFLGQEDPLEKEMQASPVFLPGEYHGWRSLVGYSPWGLKELDTTE